VRCCSAVFLLVGFGLALWSVPPAAAAPVAVDNPGFEELYLGSNLPAEYAGDVPAGAFPTGPAPAGWTSWYATGSATAAEYLGVLNPGTTADTMGGMPCFPAGAPEGDNVALLFTAGDAGGQEYGIRQPLAASLEADTLYTLTVEVGNIQSCAGLVDPFLSFFALDGFPAYRVQLLAGGVVVAEDAGALTPGEGQFETATVQLATGSAPAQLGQPLEIRLVNRSQPDVPGVDGLEVDFDDVRLEASPVSSLPLGDWAARLLVPLLALSGWRAFARRRAVQPRARLVNRARPPA
jgi:hypothetical protein